jgi:aryl-alcohol dehydrogenase
LAFRPVASEEDPMSDLIRDRTRSIRPRAGPTRSCVRNDVHAHFFGQSSFATHSVAGERNIVKIESEIPLDVAAPFGCGIQTGAGGVLNSLRAEAGSSLAVFGTGTVGLAAVLGGVTAGCTTIIGVDVNQRRLELAHELGARHVIDAAAQDAVEQIRALTSGGADHSLETSGLPAVLRQCVDCLSPTGVAGVMARQRSEQRSRST